MYDDNSAMDGGSGLYKCERSTTRTIRANVLHIELRVSGKGGTAAVATRAN